MADDAAGRWMTFAELADARGTSKRAAVVLVRRHGWRKQRNNAGHVIALVPPTWAEHEDGREGHNAGHSAPPISASVIVLEEIVTGLREDLSDANRRADEANARADVSQALAVGLRCDLAAALAAADQARAETRSARDTLTERDRVDDARKARGRLRRAWEGWRGR